MQPKQTTRDSTYYKPMKSRATQYRPKQLELLVKQPALHYWNTPCKTWMEPRPHPRKSYQAQTGYIYQNIQVSNDGSYCKTYKMACAPSEDTDQPGHPTSLIRVFAVRSVCS